MTLWRGKALAFRQRAEHRGTPKAYAPGLDGLCAVALSEGRSEPGNPRYFVVIGQRTYLLCAGEYVGGFLPIRKAS